MCLQYLQLVGQLLSIHLDTKSMTFENWVHYSIVNVILLFVDVINYTNTCFN